MTSSKSTFLSDPQNQAAAENISKIIIENLNGTELQVLDLNELVKMAGNDEIVVAQVGDRAGGFGEFDWYAIVVVPVVVEVLAELAIRLGDNVVQKYKQFHERQKRKELESQVNMYTLNYIERTGSELARKNRQKVVRITTTTIIEYLETK